MSYEPAERRFTCTLCPNGCDLVVTWADEEPVVDGAKCDKGVRYAYKEMVDPERVLTTIVKVSGGTVPIVSVRSDAPVKKSELRSLVTFLSTHRFEAPISFGQVLLDGVGQNKVGIIATAEA